MNPGFQLRPNAVDTDLRRPFSRFERVSTASGATAKTAITSVADEVGAGAVVLGTRGLTGLKSLLLGSVSHAVVQRADRPVMVVPSPELATGRAASRR